MRNSLRYLLAAALAVPMAVCAGDFPAAPGSLANAEAAGFVRLDAEALASHFTGSREERSTRGEIWRADYRADGSIELRNDGGVIDRGSFTVSTQRGGSLCLMLEKQMNQRLCSVWFASPDGSYLVGFNPTDGRPRAVSRQLSR
jgi:hypothetical protein